MFARLKNRLLLQWLANRIPGQRRHQLSMQSVFIVPTLFGFSFMILCACLFILGTNYQNNLLLLLTYFFVALGLINLFASYRNFARIRVQAKGIQPVFAGDNATFQMQLVHTTDAHPHGELKVHWWGHATGIVVDLDDTAGVISLPRFTYRRGVFSLPRVTFSSMYPLGLFKCWTHLDFTQPLTVYPKQQTCQIRLQCETDMSGEVTSHAPGHDDFQGLKAYSEGDPLNRIAWKTVARGLPPAVKVFSEQSGEAGYLIITPNERALEQQISRAAYQAVALCRQDLSYGLKIGATVIAQGSGLEHRNRCLAALASIPATEMANDQ